MRTDVLLLPHEFFFFRTGGQEITFEIRSVARYLFWHPGQSTIMASRNRNNEH